MTLWKQLRWCYEPLPECHVMPRIPEVIIGLFVRIHRPLKQHKAISKYLPLSMALPYQIIGFSMLSGSLLIKLFCLCVQYVCIYVAASTSSSTPPEDHPTFMTSSSTPSLHQLFKTSCLPSSCSYVP